MLGSDDLLALLTFNIAYDDGIFPLERHRIGLAGIYLGLAYTGARPAEFVDGEKKKPKDGTYEELFGTKGLIAGRDGLGDKEDDEPPDEHSRLLEDMLTQETEGRGRPKALCYEDILLMVVRHPETGEDVLAMAIKFIHHKGSDNKPKPYVLSHSPFPINIMLIQQPVRTIFFFTLTRRIIFCLITAIISLAVSDQAFAAPSLTSASRVFQVKNRGPVKCTPLRWKEEWLKRPVFRRFEGSVVSQDEPLPYHKLNDDMERQSLDAGHEKPIGPKAFRRGTANKANGRDIPPPAVDYQMT